MLNVSSEFKFSNAIAGIDLMLLKENERKKIGLILFHFRFNNLSLLLILLDVQKRNRIPIANKRILRYHTDVVRSQIQMAQTMQWPQRFAGYDV
jgi:hypothetical protein